MHIWVGWQGKKPFFIVYFGLAGIRCQFEADQLISSDRTKHDNGIQQYSYSYCYSRETLHALTNCTEQQHHKLLNNWCILVFLCFIFHRNMFDLRRL